MAFRIFCSESQQEEIREAVLGVVEALEDHLYIPLHAPGRDQRYGMEQDVPCLYEPL